MPRKSQSDLDFERVMHAKYPPSVFNKREHAEAYRDQMKAKGLNYKMTERDGSFLVGPAEPKQRHERFRPNIKWYDEEGREM